MSSRFRSVKALGAVAAMGLWLGATQMALAHRLDAQAFLLPGQGQVRVEAWFDNGTPARGAKVQVLGENNQIVAEGTMDSQARFVFSQTRARPLRVIVTAGGGHRKELDLFGEEWPAGAAREARVAEPAEAGGAPAVPLTPTPSEHRLKDLVLGLSFLLALAAFAMGLRNARRLRELRGQASKSSDRPAGRSRS